MKALGYGLALAGGIGIGIGVFGMLILLTTGREMDDWPIEIVLVVGGLAVGGAGELIRRRATRKPEDDHLPRQR